MTDKSEFTGERRRVALVSLAMLVAVNVMSQLDRQIMSVLVEPVRKPYHFPVTVYDTQRTVLEARDDHVKTVGAQVDGGNCPVARLVRAVIC